MLALKTPPTVIVGCPLSVSFLGGVWTTILSHHLLTGLPLDGFHLVACLLHQNLALRLSPTNSFESFHTLVKRLICLISSCYISFIYLPRSNCRDSWRTEVEILSAGRTDLKLPCSHSAFHLQFQRASNCFTPRFNPQLESLQPS